MAWIGIECPVDPGELQKWARYLRLANAATTADFLERAANLLSGVDVGNAGNERMLEIEKRAIEAVERKRNDAAARAQGIIGKLVGDGVDMEAIAKAAGMDGWRAGSASPEKNGGIKARRKKVFGHGRAAGDGTTAEIRQAALSAAETVARDRRYGESFEGWCGVELQKMGFKMRFVARGIGMDVTEAWRHVSGFAKHWRREALKGRVFPGPQDGWKERLDRSVDLARGAGMKGAHVVMNGTKDCGVGTAEGEQQ